MLNFDLDNIILDEETKITYSEWKQRKELKKQKNKELILDLILIVLLLFITI